MTLIYFFIIRLKNTIHRQFWLAAAIIPAVIMAVGMLFSSPGGIAIQVGIYGDAGFEIYAGTDWTVQQYESREALQNDVASRRLELGYAFEDNKITLYTSPATMADSVTNLLIAASRLETTAGEVAGRVLSPHMTVDTVDIQRRFDLFLEQGPLMERVTVIHGAEEERAEMNPFRRLFHGLLALFIQLLAMLCAMSYANKSEKAILNRLKFAGKFKGLIYSLSGIGVIVVMAGAVMAVTILLAAQIFPGVWVIQDAIAGVVYLLAVSSIAVVLARITPEEMYPPLILIIFIFTSLMGGVIFDLREVLESAGGLRLLFPSYYYVAMTV